MRKMIVPPTVIEGRKHRSQMTTEEIDVLEYLLFAMSGWIIESALIHAKNKGRKITHEEVEDAIKTGEVIEINTLGRVLVRSKKGICVVVDLRHRVVITVWWNHPNDTHKRLNLAQYTWNIDVIAYLHRLRSTR